MLAAREQEFRALLAEKESLLGQNREAWTLLEGRAAEIDMLQVQGFFSESRFINITLRMSVFCEAELPPDHPHVLASV